ncbi:MAG: endo-1,4-beta-xylanase, partial [Planctomycetes bacterium]|nr:endo-1,4-beta-xylanase [Planctomycetota bacterium]
RGKLNQVRNQLADWQANGLEAPQAVEERLGEALDHFVWAASSLHQPQMAAERAEAAIAAAQQASELLCDAFCEQALASRHRQSPKLGTFFGIKLGETELDDFTSRRVRAAFNTAMITFNWRQVEPTAGNTDWSVYDRQVEWCQTHGLKICGGPLLEFDDRSLPDWLCLWEGDLDSLADFMSDHIKAAVQRYRGKVSLWECAARPNIGEALSLREEDKLRLTVMAVEAVRSVDPKTPLTVRFDQPWAEYLARTDLDLSPLHFADALTRADIGVTGLGLEINLAYQPGGSLPRDRLAFNRLIDLWSCLALPLYVTLAVPSSSADDPLATSHSHPMDGVCPSGWTPESQQAWVERLAAFIVSKSAVHGLIWSQLHDAQPHDLPHAGLIDARGHSKPVMHTLAGLRRQHLV